MSKIRLSVKVIVLSCILFLGFFRIGAEETNPYKGVEDFVRELMEKADIPGVSIAIVKGDGAEYVKGFGYADLDAKKKVTPKTTFELASCSKSYTALAALQLEEKGIINLDDPVSKYFPWFYVTHKEKKYKITLRQLLHHSSGIPWNSIAKIPQGNSDDSLEKTVRNIVGIELNNIPGKKFEYATINYDVIGAVIEKASGKSYETYMQDYLFSPLGLNNTYVGVRKENTEMATGYKLGFFAPRKYTPPLLRGNNPAGYIVSNGEDMARWLKIQLGMVENEYSQLVEQTQKPDLTAVPDKTVTLYGMGWIVNQFRGGEVNHSGVNPNFASYVGFNPGKKVGVAVMVNSNSRYSFVLGNGIMKILGGEKVGDVEPTQDKLDAAASIISFFLIVFLFWLTFSLIMKLFRISRGRCRFDALTWKKLGKIVGTLIMAIPPISGVYLIPDVFAKITWDMVLVWGPTSIPVFLKLFIAVLAMIYIVYWVSLFFPDKNKYKNLVFYIMILNLLSSFSGLAIMPIIMGSFFSKISLVYILYYFALVLAISIILAKVTRTKMIHFSANIVYDMRVDLINKILSTTYQKFEKLMDGRIFTTLNNDIAVITNAVALVMGLVANIIITAAGIIYLTTISFKATIGVILSAIGIGVYYILISKKARVFMEEERTAQNVYMSLLNSLIKGYKELSIRNNKKYEFKQDMEASCVTMRDKSVISGLKFLNTEIISSSLSTMVIGLFCILVPRILFDVNIFIVISFVVVLLYVRGPITAMIGTVPHITRINVSWGRIREFNQDIGTAGKRYTLGNYFKELDLPSNREVETIKRMLSRPSVHVENLKVEDVMFKYKGNEKEEQFEVGPISFEVKKGETLFITGGNGSGKTTLVKLLAGLYVPDAGTIKINDQEVNISQLGEHYSTIFSDYHLFQKLYTVDVQNKKPEIEKFLKILEMEQKVQVIGDAFSTVDVSGGQKKRLALLQCYLEDSPIYLFDELAADQDPGFRNFIYRDLLSRMKEEGKIVIVITHDDHYFDVADKLIKMDLGKVDFFEKGVKKRDTFIRAMSLKKEEDQEEETENRAG
jgi:putative ATP-binding cassette transporter